MTLLPPCMLVYHMCVWYPWRPEDGVEFPRTKDTGSFETQCGCEELSSHPQKEQTVVLTAELNFQIQS